MQTQQRPTELVTKLPNRPPRRGLMVAAAAAIIVLAIGVGALLFNSDAPEVVDPPPTTPAPTTTVTPTTLAPALGVVDTLNEGAATADWGAVEAVFADTATLQFISPQGTSEEILIADPYSGEGIADWSGDGTVTWLDWFLRQGAEIYIGQTTTMLACEPLDATTVVCDEVRDGFVFKSAGHKATWTLTVSDGLITTFVLDLTESTANGSDPTKVGRYRVWVNENRPEMMDELFVDFVTFAVTPENLATHRQTVAEWQAAQAGS